MIEIHSPTTGHTTLYLPKVEGINPCSYAAVTIQLDEDQERPSGRWMTAPQ
jgi:hypothetical protein